MKQARERHRERRLSGPRAASRDHFEEHRSERVDIGAPIHGRGALDLLGCHVRGGPDGHALCHGAVAFECSRDTEVRQNHAPVFRHDDVVRFEVSVHDLRRMRCAETRAHLRCNLDDTRQRQCALSFQETAKRLPDHEFHREKSLFFVLADVEGSRHVHVGHAAGKLHLLAKPLQHARGQEEFTREHLQRNGLVELPIICTIHTSHATGPEKADDLVAPPEQRTRAASWSDRKLQARRARLRFGRHDGMVRSDYRVFLGGHTRGANFTANTRAMLAISRASGPSRSRRATARGAPRVQAPRRWRRGSPRRGTRQSSARGSPAPRPRTFRRTSSSPALR